MDKVKIDQLERIDRPDLEALQGLGYEHTRRAIGELLGAPQLDSDTGAGGLLSVPVLTYNDTLHTLSFSAFSYLEITRGPELSAGRTSAPEARLVRFLPSATEHPTHPLDISAHRTAGTQYSVSARRVSVATDTATRRRWDSALRAEVSYSPATRYRERVELVAHLATETPADDPAQEARFVRLFDYQVIGSQISMSRLYTALDSANTEALSEGISEGRLSTRLSALAKLSDSTKSTTLGLISHLAEIRAALFKIIDRGSADTEQAPEAQSLWNNPRRSLRSLAAELAALGTQTQADTTALEAATADLDTRTSALESPVTYTFYVRLNYLGTASSSALAEVVQAGYISKDLTRPALAFDYRGQSTSGVFGLLGNTSSSPFATLAEALRLFARPVFIFPAPAAGEAGAVVTHLSAYALQQEGDLTSNPNTPTQNIYNLTARRRHHQLTYPAAAARVADHVWIDETGTERTSHAVALAVEIPSTSYLDAEGDGLNLTMCYQITLDPNGSLFDDALQSGGSLA